MPAESLFNGPGKYDDLATVAREASGAEGVVLLIIGGKKGPGFSVQGPLHLIATLPEMLDEIAASLRRQIG